MGPIASFKDLLAALRRRAGLIVLIALLGVPFAIWFASNQPRLYQAVAVIQIELPQVTETVTGEGGGMTPDTQLALIQQQLMARDNLVSIIVQYDLFPGLPGMIDRLGAVRGAISIQRLQDPSLAWRPELHPSGILISVMLDDPQKAADVANALSTQIVAEAEARSAARASRTLEFVLAEEARVAAEIDAIEAEVARFREANVAALPEGLTAQRDRLVTLEEQRIAVDQDLIELNAGADRLRAEELAQQTALLTERRDLIVRAMADTQAAISAAPAVERQLGAYDRRLGQLEAELAVLTTRRTEAAMTQLLAAENQAERYEVLESAIVPDYPISASRRKVAMAVAGAIAFGGIALALLLEILNPAIRTAGQLQKELGVAPVIVVPILSSRARRRRRWIGWLVAAAGLTAAAWAMFADRLLPLILRRRAV
jgi:uncharacterized protein involved in exopolysaccharide biosynthesis